MRKKLCLALVVSAAVALTAFDVQAFPISPLNSSDDAGQVIQVRQGCGLGRHRGLWGGCRWNGGEVCWWHPSPWGPRRTCR